MAMASTAEVKECGVAVQLCNHATRVIVSQKLVMLLFLLLPKLKPLVSDMETDQRTTVAIQEKGNDMSPPDFLP